MHNFIDLNAVKKLFFIVISITLLFGGILFGLALKNGDVPNGGVACTLDAKLCPDGSAVGRTGPNCEFAPCPGGERREVKLFYYNPELDKDESGNIMCSRAGLVPVTRSITGSATTISDTINLLLRGELSAEERAQDITTEFPLQGLSLVGTDLVDGELTLTFTDPQNRTGGGSCRAGILWAQIETTAKQFPEVKTVRFNPEELFQP